MARVDTLDNFLEDVADSIREKKGTTEPILAKNFDTEIESISGGGSSDDFYIDDCSYLFYGGARFEHYEYLMSCLKDVNSITYMFNDNDKIINLDISTIDLSKVINAEYLCYSCKNLQSITLDFNNASNLLRIGNMISNCQKLTLLEIKNLNTSNIQNFSYAIYNCQTLKILDLSEWNFENARNISNFLGYCPELTTLVFGVNLGKGYTNRVSNSSTLKFDVSRSTKLTHDSLISIFNNLYDLNLTYDVANGGTLYTQQLVIGSDNIKKVSQEEIQIATNKGWTVS